MYYGASLSWMTTGRSSYVFTCLTTDICCMISMDLCYEHLKHNKIQRALKERIIIILSWCLLDTEVSGSIQYLYDRSNNAFL